MGYDETQKFCGFSTEDAKAHSGAPWKYKKNHCFGGLYMYRILKAYGFEDDASHIVFARKLEGKSADWSMGAALYETQYMPVTLQSRDINPAKSASQNWAQGQTVAIASNKSANLVWMVASLLVLGIVAGLVGSRMRISVNKGADVPLNGMQRDM